MGYFDDLFSDNNEEEKKRQAQQNASANSGQGNGQASSSGYFDDLFAKPSPPPAQQQTTPTPQPTPAPQKKPQQNNIFSTIGNIGNNISNAFSNGVNAVEGFFNSKQNQQPQAPNQTAQAIQNLNPDNVKKKAEDAYLKFPSLFDNPDKVANQSAQMQPESLDHMAYRAANKYTTNPIDSGIAATNDFLSYHPEALKTLATVQNDMADVGKFIDSKIGKTEAGKDVEQLGSGIVQSVAGTYLGSSNQVQQTLSKQLPQPIKMDQQVASTVGQVLGGLASFVAGGEVLKAANLGKAAMPVLFGALGFTSAPPDTSFNRRLTIAAINALGGKFFDTAGDTSGFTKEAVKAFAKIQGVNAAMTGLSDTIEGKKPKEIAQDLATAGLTLSLFHIVGTAHGLFNREVTDLKNGELPQETNAQQVTLQGEQANIQQPEQSGIQVQPNKYLSPEEKTVEGKFTDYVKGNTDEAIQRYNTLPESENGKIISTDIARELSPDYVNNRSGSSAAVHEPASALMDELYKRKLAETDPEGRNIVVFTAGGTGAGKSTAIEGIPAIKDIVDHAQMVYDSNLAKPETAIRKIQQALDAGKETVITYVHRDPVEALVNGALPRAMRMGRTVPMDAHLTTHVNAPASLLEIADHFKGDERVQIQVIDNSLGRENAQIVDLAKLENLGYNKEELKQKLSDALENEYKSGNISEQVYNGFKSGTTANGQGNGLQNGTGNGEQPEQSGKVTAPSKEQVTPEKQAAQANLTFQSKETRTKQESFNSELDSIRESSTSEEDRSTKVSGLVAKTLENSAEDRASVMGLRTALNKEMQGIVGDHGNYKKNYAMLKFMQGSDSDNARYLSSLEDHIALLDDVVRSKAMDDFARGFGKVPTDLPPASQELPHEVLMHGSIGVNPNIDKFIAQDVVPYSKDTITGMQKAFDEVGTWLAPTTKAPKSALDTIMFRKGEMEKSQFRAEQAAKDIRNMWDKQNEESRFSFMHQVETGADVPEKFQPIADFYRQRLDNAHSIISKYKDINFLDNFFPHFWEKPEAVQKFLAQVASRRPFEGSKSFLKERVFDTIKEGMDAGYKPVSTNPEELMQIYEQNVRKFVMAQDIKNDLIAKGFWKFIPSGDKVPDGFAPINDKIAKVYFPPNTTEVSINGSEIKKMIEAGQYHAQEDVARLINNYLSPDLINDTAIGKGLMNVKNTMNAFQLGLSAFHGTMETLDSVVTKASVGLSKIINEGKVFAGLKDIITAPAAPITFFRDGQKFYNNDPELLKIEQDLFTGGASLKDKQYFKNTVYDTFLQRVREENYVGAAVRTPLAAIEASMRPLFGYYIPRLKVGAFREVFSSELERNSQLIQDGKMTREELARKTWNNIENRMGEVNYDNLFWNRTFKSSAMLAFRAVGWNLGTLRELGGGILSDTPQQVMKMVKLQKPELTPKMAYTLSLLFTTASVGSLYQYLHTGKSPANLLDMFYPQNGATDKNGNPVRVQFPTYLKDLYAASHTPVKMVGDKFAPELSMVIDLLNNKDYYGNFIRNEHDNLPTQVKQTAAYMINSMNPFSIQSIQQMAKGKASIPTQLENFLGIQKAPIDTIMSDKQKRLQQAATEQLGTPGPQTPEQQQIAQLKAQARTDIMNGKHAANVDQFMQMLKSGEVKSDALKELIKGGTIKTVLQLTNFLKGVGETSNQRLFQHLSKDEQKKVLQK